MHFAHPPICMIGDLEAVRSRGPCSQQTEYKQRQSANGVHAVHADVIYKIYAFFQGSRKGPGSECYWGEIFKGLIVHFPWLRAVDCPPDWGAQGYGRPHGQEWRPHRKRIKKRIFDEFGHVQTEFNKTYDSLSLRWTLQVVGTIRCIPYELLQVVGMTRCIPYEFWEYEPAYWKNILQKKKEIRGQSKT